MRFDLDKAFGAHDQALILRSRRAELLASNLANADTPGYMAKDLDFRQALAQTLGQADASRPAATQARHFGGNGGADGVEALYRVPEQPSIDGNTVDAQKEKARFAENAVQYQTSLTFLDGRIKSMLQAIRGE